MTNTCTANDNKNETTDVYTSSSINGHVIASSKLTLREESGVEIFNVLEECEVESSVLLRLDDGQKNNVRDADEGGRGVGP